MKRQIKFAAGPKQGSGGGPSGSRHDQADYYTDYSTDNRRDDADKEDRAEHGPAATGDQAPRAAEAVGRAQILDHQGRHVHDPLHVDDDPGDDQEDEPAEGTETKQDGCDDDGAEPTQGSPER